MRIGIVFPHNEIGTDPGAIRAWAEGAEAAGFDHALIYDHVLGADPDRPGGFSGPYDKDVAFHEPFTTFAFMAAVTRSIEFVTTVLVLPQRQTALVAKQAAEVAVLSENRLRLGVGTGWNEVEYEALGESFGNRGRRQAEQVELMRALWTSESLSFAGRYHTVDKASINPRPSEPIPVWFGGAAPQLLDRCARLGDGWMPVMGPTPDARDCLTAMLDQRKALGIDAPFGVQAQAQYAGGNPDRWRRHAGKWRDIGATHLAVATHNAGETNVDGHIARALEYQAALADL
ncbi:MAG: LLM class F420-dependent oxidoreductase [Gammaproteobacteria bacterium]|nr:LLM class F420-dependent oxidoreductase [Gammaproteobacteria bacterium]